MPGLGEGQSVRRGQVQFHRAGVAEVDGGEGRATVCLIPAS